MNKCKYCGSNLSPNIEICDVCGKKQVTSNLSSQRKDRTRAYVVLGWIIIIIGVIVGLILGDTYKENVLTYESSISIEYNEYEESFNYMLMLCSAFTGFMLGIFTMGIGSICHRLDLLIDKKK